VWQFFLRNPGEEPAFLGALASFLERFDALVTFNGKAFDWPLLENRFVRNRRRLPLLDPPHIDLLHPARRLWKRRLVSCALSSLETHVLDVTRTEEDVPGYEIPYRYFSYQRTGDGTGLRGVFYHNLQDILSLAALTVHMAGVLNDPMSGLIDHPSDFLCVGKAFDRAGEPELAALCFEEALRRGALSGDRREALMRLAGVQKRQRWWDAALHTWDLLLDEGSTATLLALIEIAKYYEHVERDYAQALDAVQQALNLLDLQRLHGIGEDGRADLERRYSRLLNRSAAGRSRSRTRVG
jgi:tetratricopeptide (TPR) repeat protein